MKIKKRNDANRHLNLKDIFNKIFKFFKKVGIIFFIITFFAGLLVGLIGAGFFGTFDNPTPTVKKMLKSVGFTSETKRVLSDVLHENIRIPVNVMRGAVSNPEKVYIDISFVDYQKILYKREKSMALGLLITEEDDYVPAKIRYNNQSIDVKLRLKGDWLDHLSGHKWSFRVKVKGNDTFKGMKIFSIQDPKTREYVNEWFFQKALEKEDLISLRYDFVDVTVNGKHKGVYALEEHFDKLLIEHNAYREGPIVRFNEDLIWVNILRNATWDDTLDDISYFSGDIDTFQTTKMMQDPEKYEQFIKAKDLLESFRNESLETCDVFDCNKLAKFMAVSYVMGAIHGTRWHNGRFYYNPITSKLEPIGFDSGAGPIYSWSWDIYIQSGEPYITTMLKDPIFFKKYIQELERVSEESYLDNLLKELDDDLQKKVDIIHRDYPFYHFSEGAFYENQKYISDLLNPIKGLQAYFFGNTSSSIVLHVGNIQLMPIEIFGIKYNDSIIFYPKNNTNILEGKIYSEPVQFEKIEFMLPKGFVWSEDFISDLSLEYRVLGHSRLRNESIYPWSYISKGFPVNDFIRQTPNIYEFDFLYIDNSTKRIIIMPGSWELNRSLIIPEGYTVICNGGTKLDLKNNAKILSYSPLKFYGDEEYPIIITSSDSTGHGLIILNADEESILHNVYMSNLSAPSQDGWKLSGAITVYESFITIDNCYFSNNREGDDMLDLVRTDYNITNSIFENILFDAIDDDFGKGTITQSSFVNIGNDALDFSGAVANLSKIYINGTGDKGVSAGENSRIYIDHIEIENSQIAIASKDLSVIELDYVDIDSADIGLAAYQKKPEFGPSEIKVKNIYLINVTKERFIETASTLWIDDKMISGSEADAYGRLYYE